MPTPKLIARYGDPNDYLSPPGGEEAVSRHGVPYWMRRHEVVEVWKIGNQEVALSDDEGISALPDEEAGWQLAIQTPGRSWITPEEFPDEPFPHMKKQKALELAQDIIEDMNRSRVPDDAWPRWKADDETLSKQLIEFQSYKPTRWEYVQLLFDNDPNGAYLSLLTSPISEAEEIFEEVFFGEESDLSR